MITVFFVSKVYNFESGSIHASKSDKSRSLSASFVVLKRKIYNKSTCPITNTTCSIRFEYTLVYIVYYYIRDRQNRNQSSRLSAFSLRAVYMNAPGVIAPCGLFWTGVQNAIRDKPRSPGLTAADYRARPTGTNACKLHTITELLDSG